ncbi:TetR family transcriptional regulator [Flavobacterium rivuli WB 3.3-2 = DSM 21788]|uniref:TetR family transcriptional regulator n=1 Tax=Flavobacterium rivuli WB 3.3-2 = DSM 21788 TaxID=1121895 RepID=A0A0A2M323_9FLAO|nr:TetR/AcrR family transcriptional regulator [Flavobacterium rivuli]KGO86644.1 TetR family transcriptional regulator [Flavobacterium rivuli WB 3.3-2 = DSM 21788]
MGSKERILRLKDETRAKILDAALNIAKMEGWQALSMRKIAEQIEYTAPIIYEYFANKEGILLELTRKGYRILTKHIIDARERYEKNEDKMEAMWIAYWNFAFTHKEFYRLMYGVDMVRCSNSSCIPETDNLYEILAEVIAALFTKKPISEDIICLKYNTYWSVIHGLVSINLIHLNWRTTDALNQQILKDAIKVITLSINS